MATVGVDGGSLQPDSLTAQVGLLGLRVGGRSSLYSSKEPSELSQWPCCDDITINVGIVINFIVLYYY